MIDELALSSLRCSLCRSLTSVLKSDYPPAESTISLELPVDDAIPDDNTSELDDVSALDVMNPSPSMLRQAHACVKCAVPKEYTSPSL